MFNALVVEKDEESGKTSAAVKQIGEDDLPHGEVTGGGGVFHPELQGRAVHRAGRRAGAQVPACAGDRFRRNRRGELDDRYKPGDKVVLTGWRVGEAHWGGYAQKARVKADWLVPLPEGLIRVRRWRWAPPG